ncbi:MAG: ATP-binding protein [Nonlabens sp.]
MAQTAFQKKFNGLRIVLFGPESTGKTTLSKQLAHHFDTIAVPEYAREYLQHKMNHTGKICEYHDLIPICKGQLALENDAVNSAHKFLFCDTDALETWTYSQLYFDKAPSEIAHIIDNTHYDFYLLMDVDIPWVKDDLRDRPDDRQAIMNRFRKALKDHDKNYAVISGIENQRFENALTAITNHYENETI